MSTPVPKILLLDDDEDDFVIARDMLAEIYGGKFELEWHSDYDKALAAACQNRHDVCLVDYRLGEKTGLEFLGEAIESGCRAPLILLTGQGDSEVDMEAMRAGAADFLTKGDITPPVLERSIRYSIQQSRTLAALRQTADENSRLASAVNSLRTGVVITDPNQEENPIIFVNPAFTMLTGYSAAESLGRNSRFLFGDRTDPNVVREIDSAVSSRRSYVCTLVAYRKDGSTFWNHLSINPIFDGSGRLVNFVELQTDVTQQKFMEEQLRNAQKMEAVGRLASGLAHDFGNIISVITGYAEPLKEKLKQPELQSYVEGIKEGAARAAVLTRQLLALGREQKAEPEILNLNDVITGVEKLLVPVMAENTVLQVALDPELPPIRADAAQIEQILTNLVVNARDAMPEGGKIVVRTRKRNANGAGPLAGRPHVVLTVTDSGPGMDAKTRDQIFEPFFTTKEKGKGSGLGLSIVYNLVRQNSGSITVQSELGKGTTFIIYFPMAEEAQQPRPARIRRSREGVPTILLVEDEERMRNLIREVLESARYNVVTARDGSEALLIAEAYQRPIHLLLTDVIMPRLNGTELAGRLRGYRPDIRVLFMSGYSAGAVINRSLLGDSTEFLQKPFPPDELLERVKTLLKR
jgi:two-component system, cell cycle sensor histidine kinase and response regulator CckA